MGCTYVSFELPGKINKVRRDTYKDIRANISRCKAAYCPIRDKLLQCGARDRPPICAQTYTIGSVTLIPTTSPNLQVLGLIRVCSTRSCYQCDIKIKHLQWAFSRFSHHFHSTSYPVSQIWSQLGRCNGMWVHLMPLRLQTMDQTLSIRLIWMYEAVLVDISLDHDVMAPFSLHKIP
jgi:hypothetical protein